MPTGIYIRKVETKKKISQTLKGRKLSKETKKKMSLARKGKKISSETREKMRQHIKSEEHRRKLSEAGKKRIGNNNHRFGKSHSEETKRKMSSKQRGKKHTEETKEKIRLANLKGECGMLGKSHSSKTKLKMRLSTIKYIQEKCGGVQPRIGHNEKQILDKLEQELKHKILRQYFVKGYFLDGYIPKLNLVIEVDERPKNQERDIERQNIIEDELNCKVMRINDYPIPKTYPFV